jgi:hypothetical protein
MNKEKILEIKQNSFLQLQNEIAFINAIELRKVYCTKYTSGLSGRIEVYGYFESFNTGSACFVIIASDEPNRKQEWVVDYAYGMTHRYRLNLLSFVYNNDPRAFRPVKRDELLLLVGLKFKSTEFDKLLSSGRISLNGSKSWKTKLKLED